jgi:hypothetical protein
MTYARLMLFSVIVCLGCADAGPAVSTDGGIARLDAGSPVDSGGGQIADSAPADSSAADSGSPPDGAAVDGASLDGAAPPDGGAIPCGDLGCAPVDHGSSACVEGICVITCDEGFALAGGACVSGVVCGGGRCGAGELCSDGVCVSGCDDGVSVPGDYATLESALGALGGVGGTICLADGEHGDQELFASEHVTIIGVGGRDRVRLGDVLVGGMITMRSFTASSITTPYSALTFVRLETCRVSVGVRVTTTGISSPTAMSIDGCELIGGVTFATGAMGGSLTIDNSWIHGATGEGIRIDGAADGAGGGGELVTARVRNTTLTDNATGILLRRAVGASGVLDVTLRNLLITRSGVALDFFDAAPTSYGHIALFANTTNYAGVAVPPSPRITADPLLDGSSPPVPLAGSPLIGAGDLVEGTAYDYFGVSRLERNDIGAAQGP